jgi:hypothetical protein
MQPDQRPGALRRAGEIAPAAENFSFYAGYSEKAMHGRTFRRVSSIRCRRFAKEPVLRWHDLDQTHNARHLHRPIAGAKANGAHRPMPDYTSTVNGHR